MTDLNDLSDDALRLALARALERNAHLERLVASIGERTTNLNSFVLDISEDEYVSMSRVFEDKDEYRRQCDPDHPDHTAPFFTEAFLYSLFGKDDARTILAYFNQIQRLVEEDSEEMRRLRERREEFVRYAEIIRTYEDKKERLERALSTNEKDKYYKLPKGMNKSEARAKLEEYRDGIISMSSRLAESVSWYFEDN